MGTSVRATQNENGARSGSACRRTYYRVQALLPIRLTPIEEDDVEKAVFELSLQPARPSDDESATMERLRRIEEKLDLLLAGNDPGARRPLGVADVECVVFSGAGLAMPVEQPCRENDRFRTEILLPGAEGRVLRAVARAVADSSLMEDGVARHHVALALDHMNDEDRDALVSHSYELQRAELRARDGRELPA